MGGSGPGRQRKPRSPGDVGAGGLPVDWAQQIWRGLGVTPNQANVDLLYLVANGERGGGSSATWGQFDRGGRLNPIDNTQFEPGATAYNQNNGYPVWNYADWPSALKATIETIGAFPEVLAAARGNDLDHMKAVWTASPMGGTNLSTGDTYNPATYGAGGATGPIGGGSGGSSGGSGGSSSGGGSSSSGGGGGFWSGITDFLGSIVGDIPGLNSLVGGASAALSLPQSVAAIAGAIGVLPQKLEDLFKMLAWLTDPISWLRIFCGLIGLVLATGGVFAIAGVM